MVLEEIEGLNSKHLATGSTEPPKVANGKVRIYSMRFCPYAQRGLLGLKLKQIPFEVININLAQKPEWYLEKKNPLGKVPTIEHDGKLVYESLVCVDYLDEIYSTGCSFVPKDPYERAKQRMLTERLTALPSALYPYYRNRQDATVFKNLENAYELYESLLHQNYFAGDRPGYADFMSWPWIERLSAVEIASEGRLAVNPEKYPKFAAYIERMKAIPEIKTFLLDGPTHLKFIDGVATGKPTYDDIL
jgi:glutathione S-transferase